MKKRKPLTPEQLEARKIYMKKWKAKNLEKLAEWHREYRRLNPEKNKVNTKKYRESNPEKAKASAKKYKDKNSEKIKEARIKYKDRKNELQRENRKNNPLFKLKCIIRSGMIKGFKRINTKRVGKIEGIIGCTFNELRMYIESKFESWMTWDNHGKYNGDFNYGWDIDHIIPMVSAKTEEEIIKLSHFTNLQPLCSKINRDIKKDKF